MDFPLGLCASSAHEAQIADRLGTRRPFRALWSLSRRDVNASAREHAIERAKAKAPSPLWRAEAFTSRRDKDHEARNGRLVPDRSAIWASCALHAHKPSRKSIPPPPLRPDRKSRWDR